MLPRRSHPVWQSPSLTLQLRPHLGTSDSYIQLPADCSHHLLLNMFKTKLLISTPDLLHLPVAFPISANGGFILPQMLRPQALPSSLPSLLHLPIHLIVTPSNRVGCLFQCAQNPPTSYHDHHGPCGCSTWCRETRDSLPSCLASIVCLVLKSWVSRQVANLFQVFIVWWIFCLSSRPSPFLAPGHRFPFPSAEK